MPIAMPPAVDGPPPIAGPMPPLHGAHQTPTRMVPRPPAHHHAGVPPHHSQYAPQYHHNMVNAPMYHQGYAAPQAYYPNYYGMMSQYSNGVPPPYVNGGPVQYPNGFNGAQYPNGLNGAQYPNGLNSAQYQGVPNGAQYHNGGMPTPGHNMPYQAYSRSPNTMHQQYSPMMGITVEQNGYPHQQMQSPAVARSYQPPTVPGAMASQPTSSIQSPQMIPPPTPPTPHFKEFIPGSHVKEFIPTAKSREFVPTGSLPKTFKPVSKEIIPPVSVEVSPAQAPVPVVALPPTIAAQPEPFRPPVSFPPLDSLCQTNVIRCRGCHSPMKSFPSELETFGLPESNWLMARSYHFLSSSSQIKVRWRLKLPLRPRLPHSPTKLPRDLKLPNLRTSPTRRLLHLRLRKPPKTRLPPRHLPPPRDLILFNAQEPIQPPAILPQSLQSLL